MKISQILIVVAILLAAVLYFGGQRGADADVADIEKVGDNMDAAVDPSSTQNADEAQHTRAVIPVAAVAAHALVDKDDGNDSAAAPAEQQPADEKDAA